MANNARIYRTIKYLSVGEARVIEETGRFPDSSVKIKNALAWFKKKRSIKCEKPGGFIADCNFRFFYEENHGISLGTRFMTAIAKVYENIFQGLWVMNLDVNALREHSFMGIEFWCLQISWKISLNRNNSWWHYLSKQLIYWRNSVNIWHSRNIFWKVWIFNLKKLLLWIIVCEVLLLLLWNPFHWKQILSRFYWLSLVKNIYTKSTANNYLKSTRTSCELCSKLTTKT